jgi:hypothetical protein
MGKGSQPLAVSHSMQSIWDTKLPSAYSTFFYLIDMTGCMNTLKGRRWMLYTFPSEPKLKMLVSAGPKRTELTGESWAGHPVIWRPADMSICS